MIDAEGWEQQPGGLLLRVSPYDRNNLEHRAAARSAVRGTTEAVSSFHGAKFSEKGLHENIKLLDEGDIDDPEILLEFYEAKWDVCERAGTPDTDTPDAERHKKIDLGAAVGWYTYAYTPDGKLERAHYLEDCSVQRKELRELIRAKPYGMKFPDEGIAGCLDRISLNNMHIKDGIMYRFGEVAPDNTAMLRQLDGNGVNMGKGLDSAVLEYDGLPGNAFDCWPVDVKVRPIWWKGVKSKRSFTVRYKQGNHDVRFIVTKGRATAAGVPRIDIRPWDNGNPPDPYILESIVAATLRAIEEEARERKWNVKKQLYIPSPIIPLLESRPDIYKALFRASGDRIIIPSADVSNSFGAAVPSIHVHIIGQRHMINAFTGSQMRFFGEKPMVPGMNAVGGAIHLIS